MCMKIVYLDTELLKDAIRKVESVQHIRLFYRKSNEYQLGGIVYELRKKFQKMVKLYRKSFDHMNDEDHNKHIKRWVEIHQLHLELDNLIKATIRYQTKRDKNQEQKSQAFDEKHPTLSDEPISHKSVFPSNSDEDEVTDIENEMHGEKRLLRSRDKRLQIKAPLWRPNLNNKVNGFDNNY